MVIWSIGLGTGLQTQLGGFDSYYHLNGFGGNPRIDDESMSTKTAEWSGTKDGSYLTLEWLNTITRYRMMIKVSHYLINYCNSKVGLSPDGVMEAYLSYIQMVVVQFHLGVRCSVLTILAEQEVYMGSKSRSDTAAGL